MGKTAAISYALCAYTESHITILQVPFNTCLSTLVTGAVVLQIASIMCNSSSLCSIGSGIGIFIALFMFEWFNVHFMSMTRSRRACFDVANVLETYQPRARTHGHLFVADPPTPAVTIAEGTENHEAPKEKNAFTNARDAHYENMYQKACQMAKEMEQMEKNGASPSMDAAQDVELKAADPEQDKKFIVVVRRVADAIEAENSDNRLDGHSSASIDCLLCEAVVPMRFACFFLFFSNKPRCNDFSPFIRDRPRGLGLLQLPTGMTDERSGPFFPGLYLAGDKAGQKPASVPDVHLPGQIARFSGRSAFNPFTHMFAAAFNDDLTDSWGTGFAINGINNHGLNVRKNFDGYADAPFNSNDGMYQPFITAFTVGSEYDLSKIKEISGNFNLPIPGVNELFDFDGRFMIKGNGNGILNSAMEFPLTLADPNERAPYTFKYLNFMADRHMQYGHVVPNVNLFVVGKDKIMERLMQNRLNPTMVG
ncbi:unnamed protein product [Caenorhabditis bovis]|uniref:Uncharacterized protein n=1 Tax=Caenorhabditis bovis TaxID=2654633 RepID=A0A8S1EL66_9PELO|nr:unnamed protein product [Caenorhabditis bovis]